MATDQEYVQLYSRLRAAILSRHFAISRYFRSNLFTDSCILESNLTPNEILALNPYDETLTRWNRRRGTDNPLMMGGRLLTCLAVEDHLGDPMAQRILRSALRT